MQNRQALWSDRCAASIICLVQLIAVGLAAAQSAPETIIVARSVRESRVAPTAFCAEARVGFGNAQREDSFAFRSIAVRPSDGVVTDASVQTIGELHACVGTTPDPQTINFYAEGVVAGVTFKGRGECFVGPQNVPVDGVWLQRCFLNLSDMNDGYSGGQLTTNTLASRRIFGEESDPPGYTQTSIATIRMWRPEPAN